MLTAEPLLVLINWPTYPELFRINTDGSPEN